MRNEVDGTLAQMVNIIDCMKKIVISLLSLLALWLISPGLALAEPELDIDYKSYDFGWTPFNSTAIQYCIIRSVGTDTLVINDITSSCPCLVMPLESQILPPGDTMIIPIILEFGDRAGKVSHYCKVFTNEQRSIDDKPLLLMIEGIVVVNPSSIQPVAVKPYRLEFSRIGKIDIDSVEFTLTNKSIRNLDLDVTAFPYKECEIFVPDSLKPNSTVTGWVKIKPEYADREFLSSITIRMTDNMRFDRSLTIPIRRKSYSQ